MAGVYYSRARAKLNLDLHVKAKRDDGFHEIESLFEQVALSDELWVALGEGASSIEVYPKGLDLEEDNLVIKALGAFAKKVGRPLCARIRLVKRIPVASGLGGGSSDAACILRILNHALENPLNVRDLKSIALSLGSDVPFFLDPGCRWVYGRGEVLGKECALPNAFYVILVPDAKVSTREAYHGLGSAKGRIGFEKKDHVAGLNDFFPSVSVKVPDVPVCIRYLEECGSLKVGLSGSGPSVFGVFLEEGAAKRAFWRARSVGIRGVSKPLRGIILTHSARNLYPVFSCH